MSGYLINSQSPIRPTTSRERIFGLPDETDNPAPDKIMTFFAEARAFLNASLSDDGGIGSICQDCSSTFNFNVATVTPRDSDNNILGRQGFRNLQQLLDESKQLTAVARWKDSSSYDYSYF